MGYKSGSPNIWRILHADMGIKERPGEASNMAKQNPAGFLPRALVLGAGKGHARSNRQQKLGESVVRGNSPIPVSLGDKMVEEKLLSKSAQSMSCRMRSPDGR